MTASLLPLCVSSLSRYTSSPLLLNRQITHQNPRALGPRLPRRLRLNEYSSKGLYAINRRGQVLLVTVNEQTIVNFVSGQLNNLELAVSLAKRGNLPGAEKLMTSDEVKRTAQQQMNRALNDHARSEYG
ncbi:hypothetical protein VIGAN_10209400 [Vigna angularis var. angularis]|uniref:Clathrin heavy chain linker core motif domain-containing protein n=1 Tax=Vigna angularis var. angularis TaxID=157739 RepID=A0A0S3T5X7_PHAAN|nr:hypothetical protein VIGAN_10209400 [Vigna angularis var. angularis]